MKRTILWIVLCLILFIGCANDAINTKDQDPSREDPITDSEPSKDSNSKNEDPSTENKNTEERFLSSSNHFYSLYDGWIFYETRHSVIQVPSLWKCRLDLTEHQAVCNDWEWNIYPGVNADGDTMAFTGRFSTEKIFIYNVKDETTEALELLLPAQAISNPLVYKDNVFLSNSNNGARLEMYDRKGNFCTVISEGWIGDYGIINDSVYYLEYYHEYHLDRIGNTIFRYDMKTKEREVYFTFEPNDSFEPRVHFDENRIIVQTDVNVFVYATTEDRAPKTIELPRWHFYYYIYNEDGYLYFNYGQLPEDAEDEYAPPAYVVHYRVEPGSTDPVFFTTLQEYALFFKNGYVYYYEDNGLNGLVREKLTES